LSLNRLLQGTHKTWHGVHLGQPDWSSHSHSLAFSCEVQREKLAFYLILNAYWEALDFELPSLSSVWRRWIDTALDPPCDIVEWKMSPQVLDRHYRAGPHSVVVLLSGVD
jgi:isoamylase